MVYGDGIVVTLRQYDFGKKREKDDKNQNYGKMTTIAQLLHWVICSLGLMLCTHAIIQMCSTLYLYKQKYRFIYRFGMFVTSSSLSHCLTYLHFDSVCICEMRINVIYTHMYTILLFCVHFRELNKMCRSHATYPHSKIK